MALLLKNVREQNRFSGPYFRLRRWTVKSVSNRYKKPKYGFKQATAFKRINSGGTTSACLGCPRRTPHLNRHACTHFRAVRPRMSNCSKSMSYQPSRRCSLYASEEGGTTPLKFACRTQPTKAFSLRKRRAASTDRAVCFESGKWTAAISLCVQAKKISTTTACQPISVSVGAFRQVIRDASWAAANALYPDKQTQLSQYSEKMQPSHCLQTACVHVFSSSASLASNLC